MDWTLSNVDFLEFEDEERQIFRWTLKSHLMYVYFGSFLGFVKVTDTVPVFECIILLLSSLKVAPNSLT
jgi:hypothetical protein